MGSGNSGKYLYFSLAFSRTGKSLKMVRGPGKHWNFVNSSNKVWKTLGSSQMGQSDN